MTRKALTLLLCTLLLTSIAFAQAKPAAKKPAASAAAGAPDKALLQKVLDEWATLKTENVAKYYDKAPNDVFYDIAPLKYNGWEEYVKGFQQQMGDIASGKLTLNDDATVHHAGNLAWATATAKLSMTDKSGKTTDLDCRWTSIWEKKGANWVIVHDHFSAPMQMQ